MARPKLTEEQKRLLAQIGRNLQGLRKAAGMTQQTLADAVGADREYVSQCETGDKNFSVVRAAEYCTALDAEPNDLFAVPRES